MTGDPLMPRIVPLIVPRTLLQHWLARHCAPAAYAWLVTGLETVARAAPTLVDQYFVRIPRQLGRDDLVLSPDDYRDAGQARTGWNPVGWSIDGAARILLLLHLPGGFNEHFRRLRQIADPAEHIALLRGLQLYPNPETLLDEASLGLRTAMVPVFEAVAHYSPYPKEYFDQHRWNQMVLKALFIGSPLAPIDGLALRNNADLALMLRDYARERRAAGRNISPELWQCLAPFADAVDARRDLVAATQSPDTAERQAAIIGLALLNETLEKETV